MAAIIETPQQEIQQLIGQLIFENTALRHEVAQLRRLLEDMQEGSSGASGEEGPKP